MNIEFVESPRPSRAAWYTTAGVWVVVAILTGLNVYLKAGIAHQLEARKAAEQQVAAQIPAPKTRAAPPYQDEALAAIKRARLPEASALAELEHVAVAGIQVNSIDDNPSVSTVTVELEAVSDAVLMDYVDRLNAGMPAPKWHIRQVSAVGGRTAEGGVGAVVSASSTLSRAATIYRDF